MVIDTCAVIVYDDILTCQLGLIKMKKRSVYIVLLVTLLVTILALLQL